MEPKYLVWSEEHGAWWKGSRWGYTHFMTEAGRFSKTEAFQIVLEGNKEIIPESGFLADRKFNEVAIPDPFQ